MFTLMKSVSARDLALRQTPCLVAALLVAELFYKFGSFSLECVAFLITWFVLDAATALVWKRGLRPSRSE